jgi:hypothetical protein
MAYTRMTPDNVEPSVKKYYKHLKATTKEVVRFKCPICGDLEEDGEWHIDEHLLNHAIDARIARLWKQGQTLKEINDLYSIFNSVYPDCPDSYDSFLECHHNITKDNCFKITYLQCCDHPAYQIVNINHDGQITVWGIGGWSGGYRSKEKLGGLRDPRPKNELYVYRGKR